MTLILLMISFVAFGDDLRFNPHLKCLDDLSQKVEGTIFASTESTLPISNSLTGKSMFEGSVVTLSNGKKALIARESGYWKREIKPKAADTTAGMMIVTGEDIHFYQSPECEIGNGSENKRAVSLTWTKAEPIMMWERFQNTPLPPLLYAKAEATSKSSHACELKPHSMNTPETRKVLSNLIVSKLSSAYRNLPQSPAAKSVLDDCEKIDDPEVKAEVSKLRGLYNRKGNATAEPPNVSR